MPTTRWMMGPVSLVIRRPMGSIFSIHQRPASGMERRRSVSPVGAASTTTTS